MSSRRRRSREIALQVLCQLDVSEASPEDALRLYYELIEFDPDSSEEFKAPAASRPFAERIVYGVFHNRAEIDGLIGLASEHWRLERMSVVDRNTLRIAIYEMIHCADIPPKVSLNEAIELGKIYGSMESGAFINGILDRLYSKLQEEGSIAYKESPGEDG